MDKEYVIYKLAQKAQSGTFETAGAALDNVGRKIKNTVADVADGMGTLGKRGVEKFNNFFKNTEKGFNNGTIFKTWGGYLDKGIENVGLGAKALIPDANPKVSHKESSKNNNFAAASTTSVKPFKIK